MQHNLFIVLTVVPCHSIDSGSYHAVVFTCRSVNNNTIPYSYTSVTMAIPVLPCHAIYSVNSGSYHAMALRVIPCHNVNSGSYHAEIVVVIPCHGTITAQWSMP